MRYLSEFQAAGDFPHTDFLMILIQLGQLLFRRSGVDPLLDNGKLLRVQISKMVAILHIDKDTPR